MEPVARKSLFNGVAEVDVMPFTINGTMSFFNCDTINGDLSLNSSGTVSRNISISMTLNGTVSAQECSWITFSSFRANTTATLTGIINSPVITSGGLSGNCEGTEFSCNLNNVDIDDEAAFARSCQ